jgi:hypothetical protein
MGSDLELLPYLAGNNRTEKEKFNLNFIECLWSGKDK